MIYEFKVIKEFKIDDHVFQIDEIMEIELKPSEYDGFKQQHADILDRYFSEPIPFTHGREARLDGIAGQRMKRMNADPALGRGNMFRNAEFQPWKEW